MGSYIFSTFGCTLESPACWSPTPGILYTDWGPDCNCSKLPKWFWWGFKMEAYGGSVSVLLDWKLQKKDRKEAYAFLLHSAHACWQGSSQVPLRNGWVNRFLWAGGGYRRIRPPAFWFELMEKSVTRDYGLSEDGCHWEEALGRARWGIGQLGVHWTDRSEETEVLDGSVLMKQGKWRTWNKNLIRGWGACVCLNVEVGPVVWTLQGGSGSQG